MVIGKLHEFFTVNDTVRLTGIVYYIVTEQQTSYVSSLWRAVLHRCCVNIRVFYTATLSISKLLYCTL